MTDPLARLRRFLRELKRRNVYRVAVAYLAVAFIGIQAARLLVPPTTLPGWADDLLIYLAVFGFPIALVIAWAFEVTPEGMRRTETPNGEPTAGSSYQWAGLAAVVLLAGSFWYLTSGDEEPSPSETATAATDTARVDSGAGEESETARLGDRSIAVLPFEALGQDQPGPFTEGMHDDLLARLSNVSDLEVISRTAVQQYRDSDKTTGEIARELGVRWVLEGAVQEMQGQIQVNAQLIDPRTETHEWSDIYQRDLTAQDLFDLQGEITRRIARSLEAQITPEETERLERQPTEDLDAYRLYVRGRSHLDTRTEEGMRRAVDHFRRAIARDSSYALAWSGLADAVGLYAQYGTGGLADSLTEQEAAARRAVQLNPDLAEAHASMGLAHIQKTRNGPAALGALRRAVELRPSYARAYHWLGDLEAALGRPERALEHLRRALELNPRSPSIHTALAWTYWWLEGPEGSALEHAREAARLQPEYAHAHEVEGLILSAAGRQEEAVERFHRALERTAAGSLTWRFSIGGLGTAHARAGGTGMAREQLDRLERRGGASFNEARIRSALGDADGAFESLSGVDWTIVRLWALRFIPVFDGLRDEPRYRELIREANRAWGLDEDGSLPDSVDVSFESPADRR